MTGEDIYNNCQTILRHTDDGDALFASDLKLVQNAANGLLSSEGKVALRRLRCQCETGKYLEGPPVCGVENLTRGRGEDRRVFWKGIVVEHYDHDFWCYEGWQEEMIKDAQQLGRVCQYLEEHGITVSFENYLKYTKNVCNGDKENGSV